MIFGDLTPYALYDTSVHLLVELQTAEGTWWNFTGTQESAYHKCMSRKFIKPQNRTCKYLKCLLKTTDRRNLKRPGTHIN